MKIFSIFILSSLLLQTKQTSPGGQENSKLLFVQMVLRHGDRAPIKLYKNDPNPESLWPQGLGQLSTLGKKQHYALGKYLRKRYENFCSFTPLEVHATSSQDARCVMSAASCLASFFAPPTGGNWTFENDFPWQPIPVRYVPKKKDKYLEVKCPCQAAEDEEKRLLDSPEVKKITEECQELLTTMSEKCGEDIKNITAASKLRDTILIEKSYGHKVPPWIESHWKTLEDISVKSFYHGFNSPLMHKLRGGPLLKKIIKTFKRSIAGKFKQRKFECYFTHDSLLIALMSGLGLFNHRLPPYCATLIFELHEMSNKENCVRILYLNSTTPEKAIGEPHPLVLKGCKEHCPLETFIKHTEGVIPKDWKKECQDGGAATGMGTGGTTPSGSAGTAIGSEGTAKAKSTGSEGTAIGSEGTAKPTGCHGTTAATPAGCQGATSGCDVAATTTDGGKEQQQQQAQQF